MENTAEIHGRSQTQQYTNEMLGSTEKPWLQMNRAQSKFRWTLSGHAHTSEEEQIASQPKLCVTANVATGASDVSNTEETERSRKGGDDHQQFTHPHGSR